MNGDPQTKNQDQAKLQELGTSLGSENQNLITTNNLQQAEINDKAAQIETKKQELSLLEEKIQQVQIQSKVSEAESVYARAQAVEEAANRTKLAPRKKKETYK